MIPAIRNHLPAPRCRTAPVSDAVVWVFGPR